MCLLEVRDYKGNSSNDSSLSEFKSIFCSYLSHSSSNVVYYNITLKYLFLQESRDFQFNY